MNNKFSKVYTALVLSGVMFAANNAFGQTTEISCTAPNGCRYSHSLEISSGNSKSE